ncbi:S1 family peptidase [Horticoccus sp. 23ND18S-11]|uniref:S1 family peptidase n=1 Tax=Horticoccus sp. 23ND18S-11 TaxID=3391832 RepID=UPI0039C8CFE5
MNRSCSLLALAAIVAATGLTSAHAAPEAQAAAGRALVKRYADAVVGIELVVTVKLKMGNQEAPPREQRIEINGTVISPSGLTVTTLAGVDPQVQFDAMRAAQPGGRVPELVGAEFKEVKLRFADGKEVPARFVLKDVDLDLAFMAPETAEPGREYAHVKLSDAAEGKVLNDYFYIARAPKVLQRAPLVRIGEIVGIIEKPRRFYLLTFQDPGSPVFDMDGKVLGITVQNFANGRMTGFVVLPSADIAEMSVQAAAAQAAPVKTGG